MINDRGEPRGQLLSESDLDVLVSVEDLSDEPMSVVEARLATLANHRFDLSADALLYGQLLRLGPERHMLALVRPSRGCRWSFDIGVVTRVFCALSRANPITFTL